MCRSASRLKRLVLRRSGVVRLDTGRWLDLLLAVPEDLVGAELIPRHAQPDRGYNVVRGVGTTVDHAEGPEVA